MSVSVLQLPQRFLPGLFEFGEIGHDHIMPFNGLDTQKRFLGYHTDPGTTVIAHDRFKSLGMFLFYRYQQS